MNKSNLISSKDIFDIDLLLIDSEMNNKFTADISKFNSLINFLKECGLEQNENLIFHENFAPKMFDDKGNMGIYFLNKKNMHISAAPYSIYHEFAHFADCNFLQAKEIDFGLTRQNVNKKMMEREFVAIGYEMCLLNNFENVNYSINDKINDKLHIHYSFKWWRGFEWDEVYNNKLRSIAMNAYNTPFNDICDKIVTNIKYLKNNNYLNLFSLVKNYAN